MVPGGAPAMIVAAAPAAAGAAPDLPLDEDFATLMGGEGIAPTSTRDVSPSADDATKGLDVAPGVTGADALPTPSIVPVVLVPPTPAVATPGIAGGEGAVGDVASEGRALGGIGHDIARDAGASQPLSSAMLARTREAWSRAGSSGVAARARAGTAPSAGAETPIARGGDGGVARDGAKPAAGALDLATLQAMRGLPGQLTSASTTPAATSASSAANATTPGAVVAPNPTTAPATATPAAPPDVPTFGAGADAPVSNATVTELGTAAVAALATRGETRERGDALALDARGSGPSRETTMFVASTPGTTTEVKIDAAGVVTRHAPVAASTAILHVEARVHDARFAAACADRVVWCVHEKIQHAEIRLEPPELGPIDVRISIDGDQVHTRFAAAHQQVRDALEQTVSKLRDLVAQDGLQLASADIGTGGKHARSEQSPSAPAFAGDRRQGDADVEVKATSRRFTRRDGLIDDYA